MTIESAAARETAGRAEPEVAVASDADAAAWDEFVLRCRHATGYHEWAWRRVLERAFGHESIYLLARRSGRIEGILPLVHINSLFFGRTLTSLPFLNYGGVLADTDRVARGLVDAAAAVAHERRCGHVELRHQHRRFPDLPCKQHKVAMWLELEADMWGRLDRKVRNQIRKAQKSDLVAEHGGAELVTDFYTVFARNMRDLGTPVYSRRLFEEVLDAFPDRARLYVVRLRAAPIAAGLTYRTGATVEVPWASSIRDYNNLCPNHLLYWSVITTSGANGCKRLDFGRSTPDQATFKFKRQWGAEPQPLHWEYLLTPGRTLPDASPMNPRFQLAIGLWKKLPLAIATRVGPNIVRSIP